MTVAFFHVRPRHLFFEVVQEWNILHQYFGRCAAFVRERLLSHDCCLILDYRWVWIPVTRTSIQVMKTTDWGWRVTGRSVFVKYWSSGGSDTSTNCNNPTHLSFHYCHSTVLTVHKMLTITFLTSPSSCSRCCHWTRMWQFCCMSYYLGLMRISACHWRRNSAQNQLNERDWEILSCAQYFWFEIKMPVIDFGHFLAF